MDAHRMHMGYLAEILSLMLMQLFHCESKGAERPKVFLEIFVLDSDLASVCQRRTSMLLSIEYPHQIDSPSKYFINKNCCPVTNAKERR